MRLQHWVIAALCAVVWVVVTLCSSLQKSAAIDEVPHIASGFAALHHHDFRMNPEHPPLVKVLSVLPAYLFYRPDLRVQFNEKEVAAWADGDQNHYGYYLLFHGGRDPQRLLLMCRMVPALFGLLAGVAAFLIARRLTRSVGGGFLAAGLLLLYPELAGHSRFVTMDVPTVAACGMLSWSSLRWWRRPGYSTAIAFAGIAALGSQVKLPVTVFTGIVWLTLLLLSLVRAKFSAPGSRSARLLQVVVLGLLIAGAIYFACWVAAGFRFSYLPAGAAPPGYTRFIPPFEDASGLLVKLINWCWYQRLLPESTLATLAIVGSFSAREMFLLGEQSLTGWYHYFLVTIATKTSLTYLAALVAALIWAGYRMSTAGARRRGVRAEEWLLFGMPFLLLFALFSFSRTNIGHRHALFIYLPFAVVIARASLHWLKQNGIPRLLTGAFLGSQLLVFGFSYPHYETYFNELIRTPYKGHTLLADSNVDWGQDLPLAARYLQELGEPKCNYAAMSFNRPESFGIPQVNWILPGYPFGINMPSAAQPDPNLPSIISLNVLPSARILYPGFYKREPYLRLNSMVLYLPKSWGVRPHQ